MAKIKEKVAKIDYFGKFGKIISGNKKYFLLYFSMLQASSKTIVQFQVVTMINKKVMGKFLCCIKFGQKYRNGCLWKIASIYKKYFPKSIIFKYYRRKQVQFDTKQ